MTARVLLPRCALGLVLLLCASFCLTQQSEGDLHWHLLAGQRILEEGRVPRADSFTFTSAGRPWADLHWLFQALIAWVQRQSCWAGLDLLKIVLIVAGFGFALLAGWLRGASPTSLAALGLVAVVASQERFTLRPEAASFLLLGALLVVLEIGRRHPRAFLLVPPLMALWANLHSLFAVGLVLLGATVAGEVLDSLLRRRVDAPIGPALRPLALAAAAAVPATLLTPYGLSAWALPRQLLLERIATRNLYGQSIAEFQPPLGGHAPNVTVAAFVLFAAAVLLSLLTGLRRVRLADLLVAGAALYPALLARRNIPLFTLATLPAGSWAAAEAARRIVGHFAARGAAVPGRARAAVATLPAAACAAAALWLLGDVWSNRFFARDRTHRNFGRGEAPGSFPEGAARFVLEHRLPGEAIHSLTAGGYLARRWFPHRRSFIDGRLEVHDPALYATYLMLRVDPSSLEETARRYGAGLVLWSHNESVEATPLLRHLAGGLGWRLVYLDHAGVVFLREAAADAAGVPAVDPGDPALEHRILAEIAVANGEAARRDPAPSWLRRLLPRREVPVAEENAALFFSVIGQQRAAEVLFRQALARAPDNPTLHFNLGIALDVAGRTGEARRAYEAALQIDPSFAEARAALALRLLKDREPDAALREWTRAERFEPLPAVSSVARADLLERRGRFDEAIEDYRRALDDRRALWDDPRATVVALRSRLALLCYSRGLKDQALAEVRRALAIEPRAAAPRIVLAQLRAGEGEAAEAERIYREVIADDPASSQARAGLAALLAGAGRVDDAAREVAAAVASGIDPGVLAREPALRGLLGHPDIQRSLRGRPAPPSADRP
jgi:tetratricopeptide (TPR) repeat protein